MATPKEPSAARPKLVPLSGLLGGESTRAALLRARPPQPILLDPKPVFPHFDILGGEEDVARLIELRGRGDLSKEQRRILERFLEDRARKTLARLKVWLLLRRGRPRDFSKREIWAAGAALRRKDPKGWSWRNLARRFDPEGYAENRQLAMDRMRHGVTAFLEKQTAGAR
jgi:hypothetical protein